MKTKIRVAAVQMDAAPAPIKERLIRAGNLIEKASHDGAQLIVLPELFNTGYQYDNENFRLAETIDGQTIQWMSEQAKTHNIHLAGSIFFRDGDEIYNTAFLIAPDGKRWRYDKQFPWLWERAYFRGGDNKKVAHTELGDIGMLICWDAAHPELWQHYEGQVDIMLIMSCPPKMSSPDLVFPDAKHVPQRELGGVFNHLHANEEHFPGIDMDEQAAWLGVPVVATVGAGKVHLKLPRPYFGATFFIALRPDLWSRFRQFKQMYLETGFDKQTKIIDKAGKVVSRVEHDGDGFTLSDIDLHPTKSKPSKKQPKMRTSSIAYFVSDKMSEWALSGFYRKNKK